VISNLLFIVRMLPYQKIEMKAEVLNRLLFDLKNFFHPDVYSWQRSKDPKAEVLLAPACCYLIENKMYATQKDLFIFQKGNA